MPHWFIDSSNSVHDNTDLGYAWGLGTSDSLYILSTGYIVQTGGNSDAVHVNNTAAGCLIHVDGLIAGTKYGIENFGSNTFIEISGRVIGDGVGIWDAVGATVVVSSGGVIEGQRALVLGIGASLLNNGTITNTYAETEVDGGNVVNNGLISSSSNYAFSFTGGTSQFFTNTGTVQGGLTTSDTTSLISIDNSGLWAGRIVSSDGADSINNSGRIDGDIYMFGNNDKIFNTGRINGSIDLGDGDNQLDSSNGIVTGGIRCGNGDDYILAGAEDDTIHPGGGADSVDGGGGVNTIDYGNSARGVTVNLTNGVVRGGDAQGDHLLHIQNVNGSAFDDILAGDDGANTLYGVLGRDRINGNGGNDTIIEAGTGTAILNGGTGNDVIQLTTIDATNYGYAFTANSQVNGGAGDDTLEILNAPTIVFGAKTVLGIEHIVAGDGFNYNFTSHDATVAAGQTLEVDAGGLTGTNRIVFNGAAETNGHFDFTGGTGNDNFTGGALSDTLHGGAGSDILKGNGGADTFVFDAVPDSTFTSRDRVIDFNTAADTFQVSSAVTNIEAAVSGLVSSAANLQSLVAGKLGAHEAILVTATSGTFSGHVFLIADQNGAANYQVAGDLCIDVTGLTGALSVADFIV